MSIIYGATREEWDHFSLILGLTKDLLPVVSNPNASISPQSKIKSIGKLPSLYNSSGNVVGITDWTSKVSTEQEIDNWSSNPDLGICIQTRYIRAIDVDIADVTLSQKILKTVFKTEQFPVRVRSNSGKLLIAFALKGELPKRTFKAKGGVVEFLANGQEFVACGTHTSSVKYEWAGGLPKKFPEISLDEFEILWSILVSNYATESPSEGNLRNPKDLSPAKITNDPIASYLIEKNHVLSYGKEGQLYISCPFKANHTTDSGETETAYFCAGTRGYTCGHFKCFHANCASKLDSDFLDKIGYTSDDFDVLLDTPTDKSKFPLIDADTYAHRSHPGWLVKNVIPRARLVVMFGESGAGKSFVALDMALAIAKGQPWNGLRSKQGRVVYICAEGAGSFGKRLVAYKNGQVSELPLQIIANAPNLLQKDDALEISKSIGVADVIVVDTFAQTTPGSNENSAEDVGKALANVNGIAAATGATIILVHHAGKDLTRGARGWSGLKAAADAEIEITRDEESRAIRVSKQKDGDDGQIWDFDLVSVFTGDDTDGDTTDSCIISVSEPKPREIKIARQRGLYVQIAHDAWVALGANTMEFEELLEECVRRTPKEEGKADKRREKCRNAIMALSREGDFDIMDDVIVVNLSE